MAAVGLDEDIPDRLERRGGLDRSDSSVDIPSARFDMLAI